MKGGMTREVIFMSKSGIYVPTFAPIQRAQHNANSILNELLITSNFSWINEIKYHVSIMSMHTQGFCLLRDIDFLYSDSEIQDLLDLSAIRETNYERSAYCSPGQWMTIFDNETEDLTLSLQEVALHEST